MRRVLIYPILCCTLAVGAAACSRDNDDANATNPAHDQRAMGDDDQVEVRGCLTANRETNQFVLTANANALTSMTSRSAGVGETFHYQLVGGDNLTSYVGREVIVTGTVEGDKKDVEIESKPQSEQPVPERGEEVTPAIETEQEIEMTVAQLHVGSVTPTGTACQITQEDRR
jgi:hypothetical protein